MENFSWELGWYSKHKPLQPLFHNHRQVRPLSHCLRQGKMLQCDLPDGYSVDTMSPADRPLIEGFLCPTPTAHPSPWGALAPSHLQYK